MATEDDSDVPETGAVFTFGKSRFGDNTPSKFWIRNDRVVDISCGDEHTALVAASGRLFMFGSNAWGQLGLGHTNDINKPSRVKALKHEKVTRVACGRSHTLIATESGRLYACGANNDHQLGLGLDADRFETPKHVSSLDSTQYKMLSAGGYHSAAVTEHGEVFVWGACSEGQLGLGESSSEDNLPTKLELSEAATAVSCGYYHTALITESGNLFTFGESENGKLGLGDAASDTMEPCKVKAIRGRVKHVSCGGSHTVAVTEDGCVFTFGDGSTGQLGHGNTMLGSDSPVEVTWPSKTKIISASCGENHTAFITDKGHMYSCGDGRHGKLAQGEENFSNQFVPTYVTRFSEFTVDQVSCGGCHMLACATPRPERDEGVTASDEETVNGDVADHNAINKYRAHLAPELTASIDLSGSISARNRRRDKLPEPGTSLNRTLPTLSSSFSTKPDPLTGGDLPTTNGHLNPLDRGLLPTINTNHDRGDAGSGSEDDMRKERQCIKAESTAMTHSAPKPRPRVARSRASDDEDSAHGLSEEELDEVDGQKAEPVEVKGQEEEPEEVKVQEEELEEVDVEPEQEDGQSGAEEEPKVKEQPVAPLRSLPTRPEESEDEEDTAARPSVNQTSTKDLSDEESDTEKKTTKKGKKKTEKPVKKKKNVGMFGRKKLADSDEEEDERKSEEDEEETEAPKKTKKKTKKKAESEEELSDDEQKAKKNKTKKKPESNDEMSEEEKKTTKKKKKNKKVAESEEEASEVEKKAKKKGGKAGETEEVLEKKTKKIKFKDEVQAEQKRDKTKKEEGEDEEKEETTKEDKDDQKTKDDSGAKTENKAEEKPPVKKKSSFCTLL